MTVHFSSVKQDWATPDELFERLNRIYQFDLDAAASRENTRCATYFDECTDGLAQSWEGRRVWCNPPYGRTIGQWTAKAASESARAAFIVMLVPARTDTAWWHRATADARVEYLRGRLRFKGANSSAPFPSALLYWGC